MNSDRQIARLLNEEHRGQLDLLGKVESALGSRKADDDLLSLWDAPVNTPGLRWGC